MTLLEMIKKYEEMNVALNLEYKNQTMGNKLIEIVEEILKDLDGVMNTTSTIIQEKMAVALEKDEFSDATKLAEILSILPRR